MDRKNLINDLHVIARLLDELVIRTKEKREKNKNAVVLSNAQVRF